MSVIELQQVILAFTSTIDLHDNPYLALSQYIRDQFLPSVPTSAVVQLYCLAAVLGLTFLLVVLSIAIRIKKRIFFLYTVAHTPYYLVKPHFSLPWSIIAAIMLILFEIFLAECVALSTGELKPRLGYWIFLCWASAWLGGSFATHALGTNFLLTSAPRRQRLWSIVNNLGGVLAPILYLSIILPLGIVGGNRFSSLVSTYSEFDEFLFQLSDQWVNGTSIDVIKLVPALPLVEKVTRQEDLLWSSWRQVFTFYAISAATLVIVLVLIALGFLSSLRNTMKESQVVLSTSTDRIGAIARQQVRRTWETLVLTVVAFVLLGSIFVGISIFAALNPSSLTRSLEAQIVVLIPLYAFAILGLPTSALLVWRAAEALPNETGSLTSSSSQAKPPRSMSAFSTKAGSRGFDSEHINHKYSIELGGRDRDRSMNPNRIAAAAATATGDQLDVRYDGRSSRWVGIHVDVKVEEERDSEPGHDEDDEKI